MAPGWSVRTTTDGPVRFEIGMRWPQLWRLVQRPWVALAFAGMLWASADSGLVGSRLGVRRGGPVVIQWWRSGDDLARWAHRDMAHVLPWRRFRRHEARGTADWGIWHRLTD